MGDTKKYSSLLAIILGIIGIIWILYWDTSLTGVSILLGVASMGLGLSAVKQKDVIGYIGLILGIIVLVLFFSMLR